ncbi:MarR family winged helix-turn-helix transcriptional regulator [Nocardia sputorum]|uniref:MarR family winged helix-turn-helix transcriptional regulator n=1 Tax=Nocardia sputorum TaxID=2984338 RepID=UPI002492B734|nr:MarR family transcriptional regulator [Nocardia sputorum]
MLNPSLDDRGAFLLSQLGHHVSHRFTERLVPLGIEPAHFGILTHLARSDGCSQQELANLLRVHRNAMVGLIDELEEKGLIQRRVHPADRRAHAVHLTESAHTLLAAATAEAEALEEEIFAPLDDAERARLIQLLRRASAHAGLPRGAHPGLQRRRRATRSAPLPNSQ